MGRPHQHVPLSLRVSHLKRTEPGHPHQAEEIRHNEDPRAEKEGKEEARTVPRVSRFCTNAGINLLVYF